MFRRAMTILSAIMVAACGGPEFVVPEADETIYGFNVIWNNQGDRHNFISVIAECEVTANIRFSHAHAGHHVTVIFRDNIDLQCEAFRQHKKITGCFIDEQSIAFVQTSELIGKSALCHELLHGTIRNDDHHESDLWEVIDSLRAAWILRHCASSRGDGIFDVCS